MVRYKARYLLFQILYPTSISSSSSSATSATLEILSPSDSSVTPSTLAALLHSEIATHFGDWGAAVTSSLSIKYFSPATSTGIVRVAREHFRVVWAALTYITQVGAAGRECVVRVLHVSGTIKKVEIEAVRKARRDVERIGEGGAGGLEKVLEGFMDVDDGEDDSGEEMEGMEGMEE